MSRGKAVKVKVHESVESNTNRKKHSLSRLKCGKSSTSNLSQTPQIPTRRELQVSHDEEEPIAPSKKDEEYSREQKIKEVGEDKVIAKSGDGKKKKNYTEDEELKTKSRSSPSAVYGMFYKSRAKTVRSISLSSTRWRDSSSWELFSL